MDYFELKKIALTVLLSTFASTAIASKMTENLKSSLLDKQLGLNQLVQTTQSNNTARSYLISDTLLVEVSTYKLTESDRKLFDLPGVKINSFSTKYNRVSLELSDLSQISNIENINKVVMMFRNYGFITSVGKAESRALSKMNPPANLNVKGIGQKIGILSNSFARTPGMTGKSAITPDGNITPITLRGTLSQLSGDLPSMIDLRNDNFQSSFDIPTDEGAAMAELAYDIAPGTAIAFHTVGGSEVEFAAAITDLCTTAKSTVVVDDVLFLAEPIYQAGIIAQAATDCAKSGVPFFSAAGNSANISLRKQFKDINFNKNDTAVIPTGNDFHQWSNGTGFLELIVPAGSSPLIILQWNQPFQNINSLKGAEIDMNLYLYSAPSINSQILDRSVNLQGRDKNGVVAPFGNALEAIKVLGANVEKKYYLAIDNYFGSLTNIPQDPRTPLEFAVMFFDKISVETIINNTSQFGGATTYGHSAAEGVISVAASPWYQATRIENFSARGGNLTIFFDGRGNFNPVTKFVPDITAVNRNNTTFFGNDIPSLANIPGEPDGFPNFAGTSAAAPNAAAVAALALEMRPSLTPTKLISLLKSTATDISGGRAKLGNDDVSGAGLINVSAFLSAVNKEANVPRNNPPKLNAIVDVTIEEGNSVKFDIIATDLDDDIPVLSVSGKPANSMFNSNLDGTATFTWNTTGNDVGVYKISFTVTDGNVAFSGISVTNTMSITVTAKTTSNSGSGRTTTPNNSDSGGCSINKKANFDPILLILLLLSVLYFAWKLRVTANYPYPTKI